MEIVNSFWSESFWLVPGYSWHDLKNRPERKIYLPQIEDLYWSIPIGLLLLVVRYVLEKYIMTPMGYWLGIKRKKRPILVQNPVLEKIFLEQGMEANNNLESIAKQTDMTVREIQRWLRDREVLSKPETIQKFNECSWHFIFYITSFVYGLVVLWNKPWFWETIFCWKGWPKLDVSNDIYIYYVVELGFYWSLVFTMLSDHRRKDFNVMIIHHIATMVLMFFSWAVNYVRIGTLVLVCHDVGDFPMAAAKMMKYCGHKTLCTLFLYLFVVVWILSRLVYFPIIVIYSALFEIYEVSELAMSHRLFQGLLIVLLILHIIWTYMIARIAVRSMLSNKVGDVRSDSESE